MDSFYFVSYEYNNLTLLQFYRNLVFLSCRLRTQAFPEIDFSTITDFFTIVHIRVHILYVLQVNANRVDGVSRQDRH